MVCSSISQRVWGRWGRCTRRGSPVTVSRRGAGSADTAGSLTAGRGGLKGSADLFGEAAQAANSQLKGSARGASEE
ncbi:hypothetical protein ScoT_59930 [Streptomyces albidoflavus]|uniref:Uncharacterized protein n=1 Tax=Streptomyces albidoflavus TaxID=1886 RepID=A0AA37FFT9_9ACTN|nr:hypothetical protein ScoT_59930 [Streptomyces albidoflavus]